MGRFSGADKAEVLGGGTAKLYQYPGVHKLKVRAINQGDTPMDGYPFYASELEIVETSNENLAPGQIVTWTSVNGGSKWAAKYYLSGCKQFLGSVMDVDPNNVSEEDLEASTEDSQPAAGREVMAEVMIKPVTNKVTGETTNKNKTRFFPVM